MRRLLIAVLVFPLSAIVGAASDSAAATDEALARLLIKKGLLTREEWEALLKEAEAPATPPASAAPAGRLEHPTATASEPSTMELVDRLRDEVREELWRRDIASIAIGLRLEGETRFRSHADIGDRRSRSTTEVYLRSAQIDFEARPLPWLGASLALKSEYIGTETTNQGQEADPTPFVDQGTITLQDPEFPLYGVIGKRTQPFGAFFGDGRWATDPMTKEAYEVNQPGLTIGFFKRIIDTGLEFDLSGTVYRQEEQINHLFASGLFDSTRVVRSAAIGLREEAQDITSFILAGSVTPHRFLTLGLGYVSEPGEGRRNQTLAAWASRTWFGRLTSEVEFMAALTRERYVRQTPLEDGTVVSARLGNSFKEKVLALGLTYRLTRTILVGARYERFWDGGLAEAADVWSIRNHGSLAASYMLFERDDITARLTGEYRYSDLRRFGEARDTAAENLHELFGKVTVTYR